MKTIRCPVCKLSTGFYKQDNVDPEKPPDVFPTNLCQRTIKGKPEYISPRCDKCYDKAVKKLDRKLQKASEGR